MRFHYKREIVIVSAVLAVLILIVFVIAPFAISAVLYNGVFGKRFSTNDNYRFNLDDFDNLWLQFPALTNQLIC